jgi:proteasome beta subunit
MGTVVALESQDGVVIAGDSQAVTEENVTSKDVERVFDFDGVGAGVVGNTGDVQEFRRQLENELRSSRVEHGEDVEIDKLARIAARHARSANVTAVVATRDSDGTAHLRQVGSEGEVFDTTPIAIGSGAEIAFGRLETVSSARNTDEAESIAADTLEAVGERDADGGGEIVIWSLQNTGGNGNKSV